MKIQIVVPQLLKSILRRNQIFNDYENTNLTAEFYERTRHLKEHNAQTVFDCYYLPKAIAEILREDNYLTTPACAKDRAAAMLYSDKANGVLDEFFKFRKETTDEV